MSENKKFLFGKNKKNKAEIQDKITEDNDFFEEIVKRKTDDENLDFTGKINIPTNEYADLFSNSFDYETEESENYRRIQDERRRRVEAAAQTSGVDLKSVESEFGIAAPIPVTAENFSSTMEIEENEFQKALEKTAQTNTVEVKLNIENEKLEFTRNIDIEKYAETKELIKEETPKDLTGDEFWIYKDRVLPIHVINMQVLNQEVQKVAHDVQETVLEKASAKAQVRQVKREKIVDTKENEKDFINPMQAPAIISKMEKQLSRNRVKINACLISTIIAIIITLVHESKFTYANNNCDPTFYIILTIVLVLVCTVFCASSFMPSVKKLISGKGSPSAAVSVATIAVLVQCIMAFFYKEYIITGVAHLYGAVVAFAWLVNSIGQNYELRKNYNNFKFINSQEQKYAVNIYQEHSMAENLTKDCSVKSPVLAYQNKTRFLKRFFEISHEKTESEKNINNITPFYLLIALALCLILVLAQKNPFVAVSIFAGAMCVAIPIANIFSPELLLYKISVQLRRTGAMALSFTALQKASKINSIMIDSAEIFFGGNASLLSLNYYDGENKDKSIEYATSLMHTVGGIFEDIAVQMNKEYIEEPHLVSNYTIEYGLGVSGAVEDKKVLVGSVELMKSHNVHMPTESRYLYGENDSKNLYIAVDNKLIAIAVLMYKVDRRKKIELEEMEKNGIALVVYTKDPNVTKEMIVELCEISPSSVSVISEEFSPIYENLVSNQEERSDATVATKGRIEAILSLLNVANKNKKAVNSIAFVEFIGLIMGIFLVFVISFAGGISQLSSMAVFVFMLFWGIIAWIVPKINS